MKDFSNRYIFLFSAIMVVIVAALLSTVALLLQPRQEANRILEKKMNILASVKISTEKSEADDIYDKVITESIVVNTQGDEVSGVEAFSVDLKSENRKSPEDQSLPIFIARIENDRELVIIPLEGKGLWGPLYGYISLEEDMSTIYGINLDHDGETPGLGAEISTTWYEEMFTGKKIFDDEEFVSVKVVKGGASDSNDHAVDAVSGGTITSQGLQDMLYDTLIKYRNYFNKKRKLVYGY